MTTTISKRDLSSLQKQLDEREAQLHGEVEGKKEADQEDRDSFQGVAPDIVDIAQTRHLSDFRHAEAERDKLELIEIDQARERILNGSFGECTDCGEPIALARLKATPWVSRCIDCQELFEKTHPGAKAIVVPTGQETGTI